MEMKEIKSLFSFDSWSGNEIFKDHMLPPVQETDQRPIKLFCKDEEREK